MQKREDNGIPMVPANNARSSSSKQRNRSSGAAASAHSALQQLLLLLTLRATLLRTQLRVGRRARLTSEDRGVGHETDRKRDDGAALLA